MGKHTPGPWKIGPHGRIQTAPNEAGGCEIVVVEGSIGRGANATLIAAAPDLLAALEAARPDLVKYSNSYGGDYLKSLRLLDAAIAAATGD